MARMRKAKPRYLDFSGTESFKNDHDHYQAQLNTLRGGATRLTDVRLPTIFTFDDNGKMIDHTPRRVPERRIRRARRILWLLRQDPNSRPVDFFHHPELKDVPYETLRRIVRESEETK